MTFRRKWKASEGVRNEVRHNSRIPNTYDELLKLICDDVIIMMHDGEVSISYY